MRYDSLVCLGCRMGFMSGVLGCVDMVNLSKTDLDYASMSNALGII